MGVCEAIVESGRLARARKDLRSIKVAFPSLCFDHRILMSYARSGAPEDLSMVYLYNAFALFVQNVVVFHSARDQAAASRIPHLWLWGYPLSQSNRVSSAITRTDENGITSSNTTS